MSSGETGDFDFEVTNDFLPNLYREWLAHFFVLAAQ